MPMRCAGDGLRSGGDARSSIGTYSSHNRAAGQVWARGVSEMEPEGLGNYIFLAVRLPSTHKAIVSVSRSTSASAEVSAEVDVAVSVEVVSSVVDVLVASAVVAEVPVAASDAVSAAVSAAAAGSTLPTGSASAVASVLPQHRCLPIQRQSPAAGIMTRSDEFARRQLRSLIMSRTARSARRAWEPGADSRRSSTGYRSCLRRSALRVFRKRRTLSLIWSMPSLVAGQPALTHWSVYEAPAHDIQPSAPIEPIGRGRRDPHGRSGITVEPCPAIEHQHSDSDARDRRSDCRGPGGI